METITLNLGVYLLLHLDLNENAGIISIDSNGVDVTDRLKAGINKYLLDETVRYFDDVEIEVDEQITFFAHTEDEEGHPYLRQFQIIPLNLI